MDAVGERGGGRLRGRQYRINVVAGGSSGGTSIEGG
jgi:hypothetical protein